MLYNAWIVVLEEARLEKGWTREKAAEMAEVSIATWYRWQSGEVYPGAQQLASLARGVGLTEDELALRYSEAMAKYYRDRVHGQADPEPEVSGEALDALAARLLTEGPGGQALSTRSGVVRIDLNDLLRTLSLLRSLDPKRTRPRRLQTLTQARPIRRKKRATR